MITETERTGATKNIRSLRRAVDLMCKDCIYDPVETGTWLQQTEKCTCVLTCPLYNFRPRRRVKSNEPTTDGKNRTRTHGGRFT